MGKKFLIILLTSVSSFIFLLIPSHTNAEELDTLSLTTTSEKVDVYPALYMLVDREKALTIDDIASSTYNKAFQPSYLTQQKGGFFHTSKWLRFEVENLASADEKWLLEIAFQAIPELILYEDTATGPKEIIHTGSNHSFDQRDINQRSFIFNLPIKTGETKTFYINAQVTGDVYPPIHIWQSDALMEKGQTEFLLLGFFYGLTFVMILYNLFLYTVLRMRSYLFYVLVIFATMMGNAANNGFGFQYLWSDAPFWNSIAAPFFLCLTCIFMLLFARSFLDTDTYFTSFKKYAYFLMFLNGMVMILLFISVPIALNALLVSAALTFILVLTASIVCLIRGARQARFFVLGWFIYLAGIFITLLTTATIIPYYLVTQYAAQIAISLEVVLLSFALADKINIIRKEKLEAERKVVESQRTIVQSLREADKLKDEFLEITSHELRAPLYGMVGIAASIRAGVSGRITAELDNQLSLIMTSGNRLTSLVDDILDFSKLENNAIKLKMKPLNVIKVVEAVFYIYRPLITDKPVQLLNQIDPSTPLVMADQQRLQQIFYNLVGTALRHSKPSTIVVSAKQAGDKVSIVVTDDGNGVSDEHLLTIFEPFQQEDVGSTRDFGGTGIGLNITKQLIELHDGTLQVASVIGEGTVFDFSLNIAYDSYLTGAHEAALTFEPAFLHQPKPSIPSYHSEETAARILIADSEPVNLQMLMNQLTLAGYEIVTASNGENALEKLDEYQIDLVILDAMMSHKSGYKVCQELREQYSLMELPVLILTTGNRIHHKIAAFDVGANDYLDKPCDKQELLSRVRTLVQMKSLNQELMELNIGLEKTVKKRTEALQAANQDLTEMNKNLTTMTESRRQLLANISHELGTPVTLVNTYLQALQNNLVQANDPYFKELVNDKMKVLDRLIHDLSDLSALEAGSASLIRKETSVVAWLDKVYSHQEFDVSSYHRQFEQEFAREAMDGYYCFIDEERMDQVFSNIVVNAMKNTIEISGRITFSANIDIPGKKLMISVTDNGSGISPEHLPFIFDRFYKGTHPTAKNSKRGTGLGLAIAKEIIHVHNGSIRVESTIDVGTTFFITLPIFMG